MGEWLRRNESKKIKSSGAVEIRSITSQTGSGEKNISNKAIKSLESIESVESIEFTDSTNSTDAKDSKDSKDFFLLHLLAPFSN